MIEILLNGAEIADMAELHALLAGPLSFPTWYGNNLDALFDCLGDVAVPVKITLRAPERLAALSPRGESVAPLLRRAAGENRYIVFREE